MVTLPKPSQGDFEIAPAGNHLAICYRVIDLGTQTSEWEGQTKAKRKVMLTWELSDELMSDGRPFSISQRYTLSAHENSALRKDLESWRGKKFTDEELGSFKIEKLLGIPCLLNVSHTVKGDKTYANVTSVATLPKGMTAKELVNETLHFDLEDFRQPVYDALSDHLKEIIAKSPEYQAAVA